MEQYLLLSCMQFLPLAHSIHCVSHTRKQWRKGHFQMRKLTGHTEGVLCLEFNDNRIVSGGYDRTIRVWDMKTGKCERVIVGHEDSVKCLQFDKVRLFELVLLWNRDGAECTFQGQTPSFVWEESAPAVRAC